MIFYWSTNYKKEYLCTHFYKTNKNNQRNNYK